MSAVEPGAVIFDLDGVLVDSESLWDAARRELAARCGVAWPDGATRAMLGMSSLEWSRHMRDVVGVPLAPAEISREVVGSLERRYRREIPLIAGASAAVARLGAHWPLGLASSANRSIIDLVLAAPGLTRHFAATVSAEEVPHGKPAPDVYLEAARLLGVKADRCVAVEDSASGLRAARAASMAVIAIPNREFPPDAAAIAIADAVIDGVARLDAALVVAAATNRVR